MKYYTMKNTFTCLMGLSILLISLAGCESKITRGEEGDIVKVMVPAKAGFGNGESALADYRLTVTAEDIESPIIVPLVLAGSFLLGEVILVAGTDRLFTIEALDSDGVVIYRGTTMENVNRGEIIQLDIDLLPVAPLLKITPRYDEKLMGESFTVDVKGFNLVGLSSIEFDFLFGSTDNLIIVDSVVKGPDYSDDVRLSYLGDIDFVTVWISLAAVLTGDIVDANGDATLATVYLSTHSDTNFLFDTAVLQIEPVDLNRANGDIIDPFPDKVYLDESMIVLVKPIF